MIRKTAHLLLILAAAVTLHAQTVGGPVVGSVLTAVTALNVINASSQPLATGVLCFEPTTSQAPAPYAAGTSHNENGLYCGLVSNGVLFVGFAVSPSAANTYYHIFSATGSGPFICSHDYGTTPLTGTSWSLDTYLTSGPPFSVILAASPFTETNASAVAMYGGSLTLPTTLRQSSVLIINLSSSTAITLTTTAGQALNGTTIAAGASLLVGNYGNNDDWQNFGQGWLQTTSFVPKTVASPYTVLSSDTAILEPGGAITLPTMSAAQAVLILNTSSTSNLTITAGGGNLAGFSIAPGGGIIALNNLVGSGQNWSFGLY